MIVPTPISPRSLASIGARDLNPAIVLSTNYPQSGSESRGNQAQPFPTLPALDEQMSR